MATWELIVGFLIPFVGSIPGGVVNRTQIKTWYETLKRPWWRPPNWAFGPVWIFLYSSMGVASYLVYSEGGGLQGEARLPLYLYGSQLLLNWLWSPIFFTWHNLQLAVYEIVLLWVNVAACIVTFYPVSSTASYLMVPYLCWVSLATALTTYIYLNNPPGHASNTNTKTN